MNRGQIVKHLAIMKAFSEGADIQFLRQSDGSWQDAPDPIFSETIEYRVKPAAPKIGSKLQSCVSTNVQRTILGETCVDGCYYWIVSAHRNFRKPAYLMRKSDLMLMNDGNETMYQLL